VNGVARKLLCLLAAIALLCACRSEQRQDQRLLVFAAASLREAFTDLGRGFEDERPGTQVTFNFAGTQTLRAQIEQGAGVDVFASADARHMSELASAQRVRDIRIFARNEPVLVVASHELQSVRTFADLPLAERLVVGAKEVPIGRYTARILQNAGRKLGASWRERVERNVVSRELNVRQVLAKVSLGEADAGIVYRSDVRAAQREVGVVEIPADLNVTAEYPLAVLTNAPHPELAREWLELVLSATGQQALHRAGFGSGAE
jgi:molybdate transport system substrate-binding protein